MRRRDLGEGRLRDGVGDGQRQDVSGSEVGAVGGRERRGVRDGGLGEEIAEGGLRDEGGLESDEELERVSRGRNEMNNGKRCLIKGQTYVVYLLRRGAVELAMRHVVEDDFVAPGGQVDERNRMM